jgi:hypothetical protein
MLGRGLALTGALALIAAAPIAQAAVEPNSAVQFGAQGVVADAAVEDHIYPAARTIAAQGTMTFNVDGVHQPLLYRLDTGESLDEAHAKLEARAAELQSTTARRRMAGLGQFAAATGPDSLTAADREFGFTFLGERQVPPAVVAPFSTTSLDSGRYIMLCNVRAHYQTFDMFGLVNVLNPSPTDAQVITAHAQH